MPLKELVHDKGDKTLSLSRTIALLTFFILSAGFILTSWKKASYEVFVAYPIGVMIVFIPALVVRFMNQLEGIIKAWRGSNDIPMGN